MAEIKGKFITMACSLLELNPEAKTESLQKVKELTGKEWNELDMEGWYDTKVYDSIFKITEKHYGSVMAWAAIKVMGRRVYPTIAKTVGFPDHLKTPMDWLKWEGSTFKNDHRGAGVVPRKFTKTEPGHIVVEALSPGYDCVLMEGVYEGIFDMCKVRLFKVEQSKCVKNGDPICEYNITWQEN